MAALSRAELAQVRALQHLLISILRLLEDSFGRSELSLTVSRWIDALFISSLQPRNEMMSNGSRRLLDSVYPHRLRLVTECRSLWILGTTSSATWMWRTPSSYSTNRDWWVLEPGSRLSSRSPRPIDGSFFPPHLETRGWTTHPYSSRMATSRIAANSYESTLSTVTSVSSLASIATSVPILWSGYDGVFWLRCHLIGIPSEDLVILSSVMTRLYLSRSGQIDGMYSKNDLLETLLRCSLSRERLSTATPRD